MVMIDVLYKLEGKSELKISEEALANLSLPELLTLMKAEQDGKIKIVVDTSTTKLENAPQGTLLY